MSSTFTALANNKGGYRRSPTPAKISEALLQALIRALKPICSNNDILERHHPTVTVTPETMPKQRVSFDSAQ